MIVKMNKLTLISSVSQQERTLEELRKLKTVHIEHINQPSGDSIEEAKQSLAYVEKAKLAIASLKSSYKNKSDNNSSDIADKVIDCVNKEKDFKERLQWLYTEKERIKPFGQFNLNDFQKLIDNGLTVRLYKNGIKESIIWPQDVELIEINRDKTSLYLMAISKEEFNSPCTEILLPTLSQLDIEKEIDDINKQLSQNEKELESYASSSEKLDKICDEKQDDLTYREVKCGMSSSEHIVYLQGYIPANKINELETAAANNGWGYIIEEIGPNDHPPTLLHNPKWVEPIKAVLSVIGVVPGYKELDVSAIFLIFLSIFFALLIGDAGYGILFIGLTLFAQKKMKKAPAYVFNLLYIMSSCTVLWGILTGTYFGINFESLPSSLQNISNEWLRGYGDNNIAMNNIMFFCFVLGTTHLVIGHIWNLVRKINSWAALSDLGWICSTITMFYAVRMMVLGESFPPVMLYLLGLGLIFIVISLLFEKAYFGLVTLALDVISNFVDIISYVRLYAVGAASFAIANAFNTMAIEALGNSGIIIGGLIAALTLFGGHTLNILLCAMGILVHGIRLNTLEFSSHAGVQWGGIHYNPFKRTNEKI